MTIRYIIQALATVNMNKLIWILLVLVTVSADNDPDALYKDNLELEDLKSYKGYFLTDKLVGVMEEFMKKNKTYSLYVDSPAPTFHGCCKSVPSMKTYDMMNDLNNQQVVLVQLGDRKQYFPTETCETVANCKSDCKCKMEWLPFTAVVYLPPRMLEKVLWVVTAPAFCRCNNFGRTTTSTGGAKERDPCRDNVPTPDHPEL